MQPYIIITLTLLAALIASTAQLLFKKKLPAHASIKAIVRAVFTPWILAGLAAYLASLVVYLYALSHANLSVVYPIFASSFVFTALLSAVALKERISAKQVIGIALVFIGIGIIAMAL
jgi:drug/metabolite transporter (DMT)-like permease